MAEQLYPKILSKSELEDKIDSKLNQSRAEIIKSKIETMTEQSKHYQKLCRKWKRASNILRLFGIGLGSLTASAGVIIAALIPGGLVIPFYVPLILSSVGIAEGALSESIIFAYIKKKKLHFEDKVIHI